MMVGAAAAAFICIFRGGDNRLPKQVQSLDTSFLSREKGPKSDRGVKLPTMD